MGTFHLLLLWWGFTPLLVSGLANMLCTSEIFIRLNFAFRLVTLMAKQDHVNTKALYTVYSS